MKTFPHSSSWTATRSTPHWIDQLGVDNWTIHGILGVATAELLTLAKSAKGMLRRRDEHADGPARLARGTAATRLRMARKRPNAAGRCRRARDHPRGPSASGSNGLDESSLTQPPNEPPRSCSPHHQIGGPSGRPSRAALLARDPLDGKMRTKAPLGLAICERWRKKRNEVFPPAHLVLETPKQIPAADVAEGKQGLEVAVAVVRREVVERPVVHEKVECAGDTAQVGEVVHGERHAHPGAGGPTARLHDR